MNDNPAKAPLYRKVNTRARGVHHRVGGDFRNERHSKQVTESESMRASMHGRQNRGLDYSPLFRFLLSKVGQDWSAVHSEACSRLDQEAPIYWLVARSDEEKRELVRIGESSFYSGLFIDEHHILRQVNPSLGPDDVDVTCSCCTYTLNGVPLLRKREDAQRS